MDKDLSKIKIGGVEPGSMLERPGYLSTIVFLVGCNFRCPYCHNPELVENTSKLTLYPLEEFFSFLRKKKGWIDSVIFTGGEPTLWPQLPFLIKEVKAMGFETGLHTNGTNPQMLSDILEEKLVNYVAMDLKNDFDRYPQTVGVKIDPALIKKSLGIIKQKQNQVDAIIRITAVPGLVREEDFEKIARSLKGIKKVSLQQFRPLKCLNKKFQEVEPYSQKTLFKFAKKINQYVEEVEKDFI